MRESDYTYEVVERTGLRKRARASKISTRIKAIMAQVPRDKAARFLVKDKEEAHALAVRVRNVKDGEQHLFKAYIQQEGERWYTYAWWREIPTEDS